MKYEEIFLYLLPYLVFGLSALCLYFSMRSARHRRLVENLPTCKTTGVFIGLVELKGTAEAEEPLTSHLAEQSCVYYSYLVQERWSRLVTETYTDSKGRLRQRTRRETGWTTVDSGGQMIPFYLMDEEGVIRILPEGAKIEGMTIFSRSCGPSDPLYYDKGPLWGVANSDHLRSFTEVAIPLHAGLYVIGQSREREDMVAVEIAQDDSAPLYLISTRSEEQVRRGMLFSHWFLNLLGLGLTYGGYYLFLVTRDQIPDYTRVDFHLPAMAYLALLAMTWIWMVYNSLVNLRQMVNQAWSLVEVQLKRRYDLIPNLVLCVQALKQHEAETLKVVTWLRKQMQATPRGESGPNFKSISRVLPILIERYPDLKTSESFLHLQKEIVSTEERISLARGYFNEIATAWNTRLETIPEGWIGSLIGMKPRELMRADGFERAPVKINLAQ